MKQVFSKNCREPYGPRSIGMQMERLVPGPAAFQEQLFAIEIVNEQPPSGNEIESRDLGVHYLIITTYSTKSQFNDIQGSHYKDMESLCNHNIRAKCVVIQYIRQYKKSIHDMYIATIC